MECVIWLWICAHPHPAARLSIHPLRHGQDAQGIDAVQAAVRRLCRLPRTQWVQDQLASAALNVDALFAAREEAGASKMRLVAIVKVSYLATYLNVLAHPWGQEAVVMRDYYGQPLDAFAGNIEQVWATQEPIRFGFRRSLNLKDKATSRSYRCEFHCLRRT